MRENNSTACVGKRKLKEMRILLNLSRNSEYRNQDFIENLEETTSFTKISKYCSLPFTRTYLWISLGIFKKCVYFYYYFLICSLSDKMSDNDGFGKLTSEQIQFLFNKMSSDERKEVQETLNKCQSEVGNLQIFKSFPFY